MTNARRKSAKTGAPIVKPPPCAFCALLETALDLSYEQFALAGLALGLADSERPILPYFCEEHKVALLTVYPEAIKRTEYEPPPERPLPSPPKFDS